MYTQLPFWFRYLQCVRFDRSFNDVLLAKQRELDSQLEDGFGTGGADSPPIQSTHTAREQSRVNVTINDDDVQRRNQNMTDAIIRVRVVPNEQETFRFFGL